MANAPFLVPPLSAEELFYLQKLLGALPTPTRLRLQITIVPLSATFDLIDAGNDGSIVLPAGLNFVTGPAPLLPINAALPRGDWQLRCAIEEPGTGILRGESVATFELK